jgi:hypothetical protein
MQWLDSVSQAIAHAAQVLAVQVSEGWLWRAFLLRSAESAEAVEEMGVKLLKS